ARDGVGVNHTLAGSPLHFRLSDAERVARGGLVATRDRGFNLLDESAHARLPRRVTRGAHFGLPDALTRGSGIRHAVGSENAQSDRECPVTSPPGGRAPSKRAGGARQAIGQKENARFT